MTHPRSHDESKPNPGLSLNRGLFLEPPKLHSLHSRHNPNFAIHCPPKQPAHSAPSRAGERWSLEQHFGQGCFNVPSTPTPAANNNFFPQSLTHPPVSGSRLPAVSLSSKRSPCLDVPGRDRLGVEMKGKKRKSQTRQFLAELVSNLLSLSLPETRSPFILHLSLQQLQNNPGGVGWGF